MSDPDPNLPPLKDAASLPDSVLLRKYAGEADQRAFSELVRRHSGWVYSIAKRRSGGLDLAEECVQNVFLALARKAPRLGERSSLTPWLHRAAVLETAALLRRESRYRHAMKRHQDEISPQAMAESAHDVWKAVRDRVDEALNSLSGADREMLILHHVEGRSFPEIAKDLGATEAAAQRRGHRALEKLTARLRRGGIILPAAVLGAALTSGMKSEAAQAPLPLSGMMQAAVIAGSRTAAAGGAGSFPAWAASPAMLAAIVLVSAGLPVWWGTAPQAGMRSIPTAPVALADRKPGATDLPATGPPGKTGDSSLEFLRQALEQLRKQPDPGEPTALGLRLRKYMLALTSDQLEAVGKLLGEVPGYDGELPDIVGAYSTRLAQLRPELALELLGSAEVKGDGKDGGLRFSRTAFLDVLSRGPHLPEVLNLCAKDIELSKKLIPVWVTYDGPAAAEYAEQLLAADPKLFDRGTYLGLWLQHQPEEAVKWLDAHAETRPEIWQRSVSLNYLGLGRWTVQQMPPREAVELTLALQDPVVRNDFVTGMYRTYSKNQPEILAGLAPLLQVQDDAKPLSVSSVVTVWRKKDEPAAAAWVGSLPEGELKTAARRSLATPLPPAP